MRAIISVSDKTGVADFAKGLNQSGGIVAWDYGLQVYNAVHPIYTEGTLSGSAGFMAWRNDSW